MRSCALLVSVAFALVSTIFAVTTIDNDVQNKNVDRIIDLTTQLVRVQHKITLESATKKDVSSYVFVVPLEIVDNLSYISIKDTLRKEVKTTEEKSAEGLRYLITLTNPSANPVLYIETIFTKSLTPHPTQITQTERQLVRYIGNAYYYSYYKTLTQKTTVQLASKNVESYTTLKPSSHSESTITYGPYENIDGEYHKFIKLIIVIK